MKEFYLSGNAALFFILGLLMYSIYLHLKE